LSLQADIKICKSGAIWYNYLMSPTVFKYKNYRFLFFSREESRIHIHVTSPEGEAKFWIKPEISLAKNFGFSQNQITELKKVVEEHKNDIENAWTEHFGS
jgi:hypothetical protein